MDVIVSFQTVKALKKFTGSVGVLLKEFRSKVNQKSAAKKGATKRHKRHKRHKKEDRRLGANH
jgi:Sec-independent protein translocase protein TatA